MSQHGVDFSKKISKIKIILWFDFHTDRQKLSTILENKVVQKLKFSKNDNNEKPFSKLIFFNKKKLGKAMDFWRRKLTLKVKFRHFLTFHVNICESQTKELFFFYWLFRKIQRRRCKLFWPIKTYRGHQQDILYIFVGPKKPIKT